MRARSQSSDRRGGFILILVLVVIAALGLAALAYSELMFTERQAADVAGRQIQARLLAESGIELAKAVLAEDRQTREESGGCDDNPARFRGILVLDDEHARGRGRFTVLTRGGEDGAVRFGLANESARLNLNTLLSAGLSEADARKMLLALPEMTDEIADAILDWIDQDDEPREYGAEIESYASLDPPREPRNGPLRSIDELLLVRGVTPPLLFGTGAQSSSIADPNQGDPLTAVDSGQLDGASGGWADWLTLYSRETNLAADGQPKIDVNQSDLETLHQELSEVLEPQWATFIVAYRLQSEPYQASDKDDTSKIETEPSGELDLTASAGQELESVLDLIGQRVRVTYKGQNEAVILESPFRDDPAEMRDYLPKLMDAMTTTSSETISGRINLYLAPREILEAIPGMTGEIVEGIVSQRESARTSSEPHFSNETWLLAEGIVERDVMKSLMPFITTGGDVYRCQAAGFFDKDGPMARMEAVLDATQEPVAVVFWKDQTRMGRVYSLETLGAESELSQPLTGTSPP